MSILSLIAAIMMLASSIPAVPSGTPAKEPAKVTAFVSAPAKTPVPARTPAPSVSGVHEHTGGNHSNNGVCTVCGATYQNHAPREWWQSENSTWHYQRCGWRDCGYKYQQAYHKRTKIVVQDSNGTTWYCEDCDSKYWVKR